MNTLFSDVGQGKVLSFGELLLRISPDGDGNWLKENNLPFYVGGAELNVARALALWGLPSAYFTALPGNSITAQLLDHLQQKNIDTSPVMFDGHRIGLYYLTRGSDMKHSSVIYDRADSGGFAGLAPGILDWDRLLDGVSWFHFSAICPALGQNVADVCAEALEAASSKNITISVDLNYRAKLWQYGKTPQQIMPALVERCNLVMGNIWALETMLDIELAGAVSENSNKNAYINASKMVSERLLRLFPACRAVANTFRFDVGPGINYYTTLMAGNEFYTSAGYESSTIIDKVGSGDCFMAGLIYGFYAGLSPEETHNFATAAAFEKLFVPGDATNKSVEEIKKTIK